MSPDRRRGVSGSCARSSSWACSSTRYTDRSNLDQIGSAAHRRGRPAGGRGVAGAAEEQPQHAAAGEAADPCTSPGSNADNIGNQAGGWTLTWQGGSTNVIPGDTILDGHRGSARRRRDLQRGRVGASPARCGRGGRGRRDAVLRRLRRRRRAAVGLDPGDNGVPQQEKTMLLSDADQAAVRQGVRGHGQVRGAGRLGPADVIDPTCCPRSTPSSPPGCPAARAPAWRTSCSARAPFTGKLSVSWPRTVAQEPINVGDRTTTRCTRTAGACVLTEAPSERRAAGHPSVG